MADRAAGPRTVESDAGVFTSLVESLGVRDVQVEELLTLDAAELAALQPLYGVIFLFKYPSDAAAAATTTATTRTRTQATQVTPQTTTTTTPVPPDGALDAAAAGSLFFVAQTIRNACATQALLAVLLNATAVDVGPHLAGFRDFAMALPPDVRGDALGNAALIRDVHNGFARSNPFVDETRAPADPDDDNDDDDAAAAFHFVAYAPVAGTLYELYGLQPAPIAHGPCPGPDDFPARVADVLRRRVARYDAAEIRFNLLAVCRDLRLRALDFADEDLRREERKRRDWLFENALRRHNFVAFSAEVLKAVIRNRLRAGPHAFDAWVDESLDRKSAADARRGRRHAARHVEQG